MIVQFKIPIFSWTMKYTESKKECEKLFNDHGLPQYELMSQNVAGITHADYVKRVMIVGVFDKSNWTLSHEMNHVVIRILDEMQAVINNDSSETFCRLHDFLCMETIRLKKNKK